MNTQVSLDKDQLVVTGDNQKISISAIEKAEILLVTQKKDSVHVILNAVANAMSSSLGNGDEKIDIYIKITKLDGSSEKFKMNDSLLVRNSLDFHQCSRDARELVADIRKKQKKH